MLRKFITWFCQDDCTNFSQARAGRSMELLFNFKLKWFRLGIVLCKMRWVYFTSKTPYVAIDERGLVRNIHLFLFSCLH